MEFVEYPKKVKKQLLKIAISFLTMILLLIPNGYSGIIRNAVTKEMFKYIFTATRIVFFICSGIIIFSFFELLILKILHSKSKKKLTGIVEKFKNICWGVSFTGILLIVIGFPVWAEKITGIGFVSMTYKLIFVIIFSIVSVFLSLWLEYRINNK